MAPVPAVGVPAPGLPAKIAAEGSFLASAGSAVALGLSDDLDQESRVDHRLLKLVDEARAVARQVDEFPHDLPLGSSSFWRISLSCQIAMRSTGWSRSGRVSSRPGP